MLGRRCTLIVFIAACSFGFLAVDVATWFCFEGPFQATLVIGVLTAQLTVISVWGTLVKGTFWLRLPWTLFLLVVSWCAFAWGIALGDGERNIVAMLNFGVYWLFGFVTSFIPLKIAAFCFRWTITQDAMVHRDEQASSRYALHDMMIGIFVLAVTMALIRFALAGEQIDLDQAFESSGLGDPTGLFIISIFGVVSLLVKIPCIWIGLGAKANDIPGKVLVWAIYCFFLALTEIIVMTAVLGPPAGDDVEVFLGIMLSHFVMGGIVLTVCLALRGLGYRLDRNVVGALPIATAESAAS